MSIIMSPLSLIGVVYYRSGFYRAMRPAGGTRRISVRNSKILSAPVIVGAVLSLVMVAPLAAQDDDAPAPPRAGRGGGPPAPSKPTPRWPDGSVNLGAPPGQKGNWDGGGLLATNPKNYEVLLGRRVPTGQVDIKDVPLQEWARALLDYRHAQFIADEPYTRCKPSPGPRSLATAYGVELMNIPGSGRVYLFQQGGAHSFRTIYVDGRQHPKDLIPSYFGHSIGRWEGDTLIIDTV